MKKLIFLVVIVIFVLANLSEAQDDTTKARRQFRKINQSAFGLGETLIYEINYGFVTAGTATLSVASDYITVNGRRCYDIQLRVVSSPSFEWIYKVNDYYRCYMDAEGLFTWKFEQHIREGNYKRDFEAIFDQENLRVKTYTGETEPKKFEGEFDIPEYVQDIMSAFYYARTLDLNSMGPGSTIQLQNFYKDKVYPLNVKFHEKTTEDVPAGEFRTIKLEPLVKEGGLFKSEGEILVWVTDDDRKMPVLVKSKVLIGSIKVELIEYRNLAGPLNSKVK
ncbi:MAG: DUF3108 domain-containing protein [Ignavibacteria bacterium]|nr:DUF3108 domain-containing protein [Ignavibacteria bacterium]